MMPYVAIIIVKQHNKPECFFFEIDFLLGWLCFRGTMWASREIWAAGHLSNMLNNVNNTVA